MPEVHLFDQRLQIEVLYGLIGEAKKCLDSVTAEAARELRIKMSN
jgi:hypothetical protein